MTELEFLKQLHGSGRISRRDFVGRALALGASASAIATDWIQGTSKKVGGITPHGGFDMDNGYVCEQAWPKA